MGEGIPGDRDSSVCVCVCVYNFFGGGPSLVLILQRAARKGLECG